MYTVFDDKSWNECQQKGIMVLGMDDIGDYSQFASKEALRQELIDVYDSSTSRKNQALMAWNFANTVSVNDVIFAKRSNTLVGKGIVTGNYVFDDLRQEYKNVHAVKWLQVGEWEHPGNAVAKRLMHCTVCKEPVEAFYPKGSLLEMRKHHRQCACERKAYAEEAQYYKEKEHRELIARNKKICFEEKEMEGFTFQNVERDSGVIRIAEEYVTNWQKMKQNHMGYLFWGPVGTGKSYLAACIANALLEKEVTVKMTNFNTILNDLFAAEDKTEYIRSLNGYELLIIDDLGVERSSEYALENIFSVIDWRYRSGKPLIITTNLPLAQLKQETKIEKKRIYDRILERCIPVKIDGVSRREAMANDNMQTMKNILKI